MLLPPNSKREHFFSVDVEEYFQVSAFEGVVSRADWTTLPSRVGECVERMLTLMERHRATGTFFTLGWIAERYPALVRRIADAGHEVASHGWSHRRVSTLTPDQFRDEVRSSKEVLEDVTGQPVLGFRAPSFSILPGGEWAFDILVEEGYAYDSSLFPIHRPGYGYPDAPRFPHVLDRTAGPLLEFPMTTTVMGGMRIPASGGGYFRHFPYSITRRAFREHTEAGIPAMFYIHPWEMDVGQPRLRAPLLTRVRHYAGIGRTEGRLDRLLSEFRFTSIASRLPLEAVPVRASAPAGVEAAPAGSRRGAATAP